METPAQAALWFLPFVLPIALWVAWSDMKWMKIPNESVVALTVIFLAVGPFLLPLDDWGWRLLHLAVVLVIGFVVSILGLVGAGDAKFAAAMAPFVALGDAAEFMFILAATMLAAFVTHRAARAAPAVRRALPDWQSWSSGKDFPMGLALAGALVFYLVTAAGV